MSCQCDPRARERRFNGAARSRGRGFWSAPEQGFGAGLLHSKRSIWVSCDLVRISPQSFLRSGLLQFTLQPFRCRRAGRSAERRKVAVERLVETREKCGSERTVCVV